MKRRRVLQNRTFNLARARANVGISISKPLCIIIASLAISIWLGGIPPLPLSAFPNTRPCHAFACECPHLGSSWDVPFVSPGSSKHGGFPKAHFRQSGCCRRWPRGDKILPLQVTLKCFVGSRKSRSISIFTQQCDDVVSRAGMPVKEALGRSRVNI